MKQKNYGVIAIFAVIILAFLGLLGFSLVKKADEKVDYAAYDPSSSSKTQKGDWTTYIEANADNGNIADHVKGDKDKAKIFLVEFADYQCPGCASMNPRLNTLLKRYPDGEVALIYRNFIMTYHQNGTAAASAAEAAALQGYYKQYADMLFSNQSNWEYSSVDERTTSFTSLFESIAGEDGDVDKFTSDMNSQAVQKKISFDMGLANYIEAPGTPSIYLDGERIDFSSATTEEAFYELMNDKIQASLKEKGEKEAKYDNTITTSS